MLGSAFSSLPHSGVSIALAGLFLALVERVNQEAKVERRPDAAITSMSVGTKDEKSVKNVLMRQS